MQAIKFIEHFHVFSSQQMHNYGEIVAVEQSNEDNKQSNEPKSDSACHTDLNSEINDSQIVEKIEDSTNDTIQIEHDHTNDDAEKSTNNAESEWQAPVSLKGFKKKLNEIFTVKFVTNPIFVEQNLKHVKITVPVFFISKMHLRWLCILL